MAEKPLLDLDTLIVRPTILVDGVTYELMSADELSVLASHRFGVWGQRIEALSAQEDDAAGAEREELIDKVCRAAIVGMPEAVFEKLSGAHKSAITDVFTGLLLRNRLKAAGAMATAMGVSRIGERPFPGSTDISEDRPAGGWRKRLLRWFART